GACHPPKRKPPLVSSSGPPGAWATPSSVVKRSMMMRPVMQESCDRTTRVSMASARSSRPTRCRGTIRLAGDAAASAPPYGGRMPEPTFTRTPTPRDLRQDLLLAAVMLVGGIISAGLSTVARMYGDDQAPMWSALIVVLGVTAPLAVRRR